MEGESPTLKNKNSQYLFHFFPVRHSLLPQEMFLTYPFSTESIAFLFKKNISCSSYNHPRSLCIYKKKNFIAPFFEWGSTASRLERLRGGSLRFTTKFLEIPESHFIDPGRMKCRVDLKATQWFWTRHPWIWNPTP